MRGKDEKKKLLAAARETESRPLKHGEFECPVCGGVASVRHENGITWAECHACGLRAAERMKEGQAWKQK